MLQIDLGSEGSTYEGSDQTESLMSFPISITGTISLPKETSDLRGVEEVCGQVENLLESARATVIIRQDGSIVFTAGIFRIVTSWNMLVAINYGKIVVKDAGPVVRISYFASTVEMLILTTLMLCIISANPLSRSICLEFSRMAKR